MNTIYLGKENNAVAPCVATIGFFDGVHRGHKYLIQQVNSIAKACGLASTVITFDRHPRQVLQSDYVPQLLNPLDRKLLLLSKTGIDNAVVLPFDASVAQLSAYDFMKEVLRNRLNVKKLVIGYDNRFGHNRTETFEDYVRYGHELGIEVIHHTAFVLHGVNISSSVIRSFLQAGEVEMATLCLGYPYTLIGKVVHGFAQGRLMGFPTANMDVAESGQLIPATGVYAVNVKLKNQLHLLHGMMNIGCRPTFNGTTLALEVNIFNFRGDLYGELIEVSFIRHIRKERKFNSAAELAEQLQQDRTMIEEQFNKDRDL